MEDFFQFSVFDTTKKPFKIDKFVRLIELFAGYGSQHIGLERLGVDFESYRICEWAVKSIQAYKDLHFGNDNTDYSQGMSKDEIVDYLFEKGISADYNKPMTREQINRMGEDKCRTVYNNIKATHNLVSVTTVTADDLGIVDTDKYCYIMTYSFPCQDLSLAGKQKGMAKGDDTRSGLLWEVERLLNECSELPQVLLMENVPQVHGSKNKEHFDKWIKFLESKGYSNYWKDLNAKNFGIPQNRNRTFMVSVLGNYTYEFPKEFPLELRLKDMLEDSVDEKYYISNERVDKIVSSAFAQEKTRIQTTDVCGTLLARDYKDPKCVEVEPIRLGGLYDDEKGKHQAGSIWDKDGLSPTVDTMQGGNRQPLVVDEPQVIGGIGEKKSNGGRQWYLQDRVYDNNIATSVTTGFNPYYKVEEPNERFFKQALETVAENDCSVGDTVDAYNKRVNKSGISPTVTTRPEGFKTAILPVVNVVGNYSPSGHDASRVVDAEGLAPTVKENHGTVTAICEPLAYDEQNGYIRKDGTVGTLTTDGSSPKHNNRVIENCYVSEKGVRFICSPKRGMATDVNAEISQPLTAKGQQNWTGSFISPDIESLEKSSTIGSTEPTKINLKNGETVYFDGENFSPEIIREEPLEREGWHEYAKEVLSAQGVCRTLSTQSNNLATKVKEPCSLRIRKLTPRECWRLMGVKDEHFEKVAKNQSNSSLYHLAGDSIVVDVLYYIFRQMFAESEETL
jgi:DNA (cytosine-5)-methyltransferase 1